MGKGICVCIAVCYDIRFSYRVQQQSPKWFFLSHRVCILVKNITRNYSVLLFFMNKRFQIHCLLDTLHAGIETKQLNSHVVKYLLPMFYRIDCSWLAVQGVLHMFIRTVTI